MSGHVRISGGNWSHDVQRAIACQYAVHSQKDVKELSWMHAQKSIAIRPEIGLSCSLAGSRTHAPIAV